MIRWLDALGWAKWPSLLLLASPLAAYPFWLPEPEPATECGTAVWKGRTFRVFRHANGEGFTLRPSQQTAVSGARVLSSPTAFDSGGMIFGPDDPLLGSLSCSF